MHMTIKIRERLFSVFFASSLFLFGGAIAVVWFLGLDGLYQVLPGWRLEASPAAFYTVTGSAVVSGLFAVVVTGLVAFRSGKTVSVEIFFFKANSLNALTAGNMIESISGVFPKSNASTASCTKVPSSADLSVLAFAEA